MKHRLDPGGGGLRATYDILEATEGLLGALRSTGLGEKIATEPHLRELWGSAGRKEQVVIAAIVSALELPRRRKVSP